MATKIVLDKTLDLTGFTCDVVMLRTKQALADLEKGSLLEIKSSDSCSEYEIPNWVKRAGHLVVSVTKNSGSIKFVIEKI